MIYDQKYLKETVADYKSKLKEKGLEFTDEYFSLLEQILTDKFLPETSSPEEQNIDRVLLGSLSEKRKGGYNKGMDVRVCNALVNFIYQYDPERKEDVKEGDALKLYEVAMNCTTPSGSINYATWGGYNLPKGFGKQTLLLLEKYLFKRGLINERPYQELLKKSSTKKKK